MKKLIFLLFVLLNVTAFSQPDLIFNLPFGGPENETAMDVIQNSDGNFVMAGKTYSYGAGGSDMYIVTVLPDGTSPTAWTYGGVGNESAYSIKQLPESDGGYIIAGSTDTYASPSHLRDMWLVKTDVSGVEEWSQTYDVEGSATCVSLTSDGGYLVAGANLIKTDNLGNMQWSQPFSCASALQTIDGGYIALGGSFSETMELIRLDDTGVILWTQYFGGTGLNFPQEVLQTVDGGYMISAITNYYGAGELDVWLIKTDNLGSEEWSETYGDIYHDECHGIKQTVDGGYVLTGIKQVNYLYNNDIWVVKIDAQGTMQWDWSIDLGDANWGQAVIQTADNGYAAAGMTRADDAEGDDMYLVSFGPDPLTAWFTGTPTSIGVGQTVQFADGTLGDPTGYTFEWTFNSGTPATPITQNPSVTYYVEGTFDVTLKWLDGSTIVSELTRSDYITVGSTPPAPTGYCASSGDATNNWVNSVSLNGQANPSGSSGTTGYEDYTTVIFNLDAGGSYDIILEPGSVPSHKKTLKTWRVWIDFDLEGDFGTGEEVLAIDNKKGEVSGTIIIPPDFSGETRMRVSVSTEMIPLPCGYIMSGEVEDYTILVEPSIPQPPVADFYADPMQTEPGELVYFYDQSINGPDIFEWDFNNDGIIDSHEQNPVESFPEGTYTITLTASNSLGSDTEIKENYIISSSPPPPGSYCEPENIQNNLITNIREVDIDGLANYSSMNPSGYYYFYNFGPYNLNVGGTHSVTLTPGDSRARNFWRLWIDLNGDGDFEDEGELLIIANNKKGVITASINIPADPSLLTPGITRMRVSMKREGAPLGPCDNDFDGEVEDYNVIFIDELKEAPTVSSVNELSDITLYPNPVHGDHLTIEFKNLSQKASIQIFSKFGAVVDQIKTNNDKITINVADYAAGIYFVKVNNAGNLHMVKFVKR